MQGLRIVVTGGIGSGKSTVSGILQRLGAQVFDADACARGLTAPGGAALPALREVFGPAVFLSDDTLDRNSLREQVFSDAEAKARLEAILHPQIARAADQADQHAGPCTLVYDIPLVHPGSHWRRRSHRILVVDCPESVQIERVRHRSGLSTEAVQSIIDQQLQRPTRRGLADAILLNVDPSLQMLERNVESVWNHWHQTAWKSQAV